jgi:hypothetical protein
MLNGAVDTRSLFRGGDAVDVCLGLDSRADPARAQPVAGDLRLVLTRMQDGHTAAALYRPASDETPATRRQRYYSPAGGEVFLAVAGPITGAAVAVQSAGESWTLEASIPWKALGVEAPESGARLRGDVGVLHGDQNSLKTVDRFYWAGKTQTCVSDEPTEARLTPALWGEVDVQDDPDAQALIAVPSMEGATRLDGR